MPTTPPHTPISSTLNARHFFFNAAQQVPTYLQQPALRDKTTFESFINSFFEIHSNYQLNDPLIEYVLFLYPGSFNPVHKGHLGVMDAAHIALNNDYNIAILNSEPDKSNETNTFLFGKRMLVGIIMLPHPDKLLGYTKMPLLSAEQRNQACCLATQGYPDYFVYPMHLRYEDLMISIQTNFPFLKPILLEGSDHCRSGQYNNSISREWKGKRFMVARPDYPLHSDAADFTAFHLPNTPKDASSTAIRSLLTSTQNILSPKDVETLSTIPETVIDYLKKEKFLPDFCSLAERPTQ